VTRLALLAVVAVLATACGGSRTPKAEPGPFAVSVVLMISHNQYSTVWAHLHPKDQAVAPLAEYVGCETKNPVIAVPDVVKVVSVNDESVGLGDGKFVKSKAVDVRMNYPGGFHVVHTVHLVAADGEWKFILPSWRYRDYKADKCPTDQTAKPPSNA
jgi:hypothetical protein